MSSGNPTHFTLTASIFQAPLVRFLAWADLNGDGIPDLVGRTSVPYGEASHLRFALGQPGGGFAADAALIAGGAGPLFVDPHVLVGDATGDGRPDIAVYDAGTYDWSARLTRGGEPVLLVAGEDGRFTASTALRDASAPLVSDPGSDYRGGFQVDLTMGVKSVAAGDIDGDGDLDLWVESTGSANITSHFLVNNGDGSFTVDLNDRLPEAALFGNRAAGDYYRYGIGRLLDVAGDPLPDLFLGQIRDNDPTHLGQSSYLVVNDGSGRFPESHRIALPRPDFYSAYTSVQAVAAGDLNGDGRRDLVLVHTRNDDVSGPGVEPPWTGNYIQVLLQTPQGQFEDQTPRWMGDQSRWSGTDVTDVAVDVRVADVNHDGQADVLIGWRDWVRPSADRPFLFLGGQGRLTAADPALVTGGDAYFGEGLRGLDFNGDGWIDFVHLDSGPGANGSYDGGGDDVTVLVTQLGHGPLGAPQPAPSEVVRAGQRAEYTVAREGDGSFSLARAGTTERLEGVQRLRFDDLSVNLRVGEAARSLSPEQLDALVELYIAYINRVPDADGMAFWIAQYRAGATLDQIGESFYAAALQWGELTGYEAGMTDGDFVTLVYRNVLGRSTPDAEGLAFWSEALAAGSATRGTLVASMLASAHTFQGDAQFGYVADLLDNKIAVGRNFAIEQGLVHNSPSDAISHGMAVAAAVTPTDTAAAIALIGVSDGLNLYA